MKNEIVNKNNVLLASAVKVLACTVHKRVYKKGTKIRTILDIQHISNKCF